MLSFVLLSTGGALAEKKYDPGVTDTEIKIGNTMPYSGPASAYSLIGKAQAAYFKKINDEGGVNGRKINYISYDDSYSPPKTVEQARRLVENDEVLFLLSPLGAPTSAAIQRYMNAKAVPMLFIVAGTAKLNEPETSPWTMGMQPTSQTEGRIYAKYILKEKPDSKVAVLYQNDDFGRDFLKGLKEGLGSKQSMIVAERSYEVSEPAIDTHIVQLKASGADVFLNFATVKFAAQGIKRVAELGWSPLHFIPSTSSSIGSVIKPAGMDNAQNVLSAVYMKDPVDPKWATDSGMKNFSTFLTTYMPGSDSTDSLLLFGYFLGQSAVHVLQQCGDNLTRENVMRQAANLRNVSSDVLLPGVKLNTTPTSFPPIKQMQIMRFQGTEWKLVGDLINP
jgi:branched-chain amino acid transport system substrate-binding protein